MDTHLDDTGGMRRTHLRGHTNILKRLLIHAGGFNLGLLMRQLIGFGTPRGLQGRLATVIATLWVLLGSTRRGFVLISASIRAITASRGWGSAPTTIVVNSSAAATCTTGFHLGSGCGMVRNETRRNSAPQPARTGVVSACTWQPRWKSG